MKVSSIILTRRNVDTWGQLERAIDENNRDSQQPDVWDFTLVPRELKNKVKQPILGTFKVTMCEWWSHETQQLWSLGTPRLSMLF
jgi:hypothetical protein